MPSSIEQYLLHAALLCGMNPTNGTVVYRHQLFFVANRDLGSRNHDSDFQRALETAVDRKGLFQNAEKGQGEYIITPSGYAAATAYAGTVQSRYTPTRRDDFRLTVRGHVGKTKVELKTRGVKSTVFLDGQVIRAATDACRRLELIAGLSLPTQGTSAVRVLHDFAIDRDFEIEFN